MALFALLGVLRGFPAAAYRRMSHRKPLCGLDRDKNCSFLNWTLINLGIEEFQTKSLNISGMDDLFLKRVLFEWLRGRQKEQAHDEIVSLKEIADRVANRLIFQRQVPVLSLRALATSSRVLKKDYPWSDYLEKLPEGSINYN